MSTVTFGGFVVECFLSLFSTNEWVNGANNMTRLPRDEHDTKTALFITNSTTTGAAAAAAAANQPSSLSSSPLPRPLVTLRDEIALRATARARLPHILHHR